MPVKTELEDLDIQLARRFEDNSIAFSFTSEKPDAIAVSVMKYWKP